MKILFIHFGNEESFFFLSSCFSALKEANKAVSISILVEKRMSSFLKHFHYIDSIFYRQEAFWSKRQLKAKLNQENFDFLIDAQREFFKDAFWLAKKLKLKNKIGYNFPGKNEPYSIPIRKDKQRHIHDYYFLALEYFNIPKDFSPTLKIDEEKISIQSDYKDEELGEKARVFISRKESFSGKNWNSFLPLIENHNLKLFNLILDSQEFTKAERESLSQHAHIFFFDLSQIENRAFIIQEIQFLISSSNIDFLLSQFYRKKVLLLKHENTDLVQPFSSGSYSITARFPEDQIQLDSVIKALRQLILD